MAVGFVRGTRVEHERRPDLHLIAAGQHLLLHPLSVDDVPLELLRSETV